MKTIAIATIIASLFAVAAFADDLPDETPGTKYNGGLDIVRVGVEDKVEYQAQQLATFGKQTRVIQVEIPVRVVAKWRRYYTANFVMKYAATFNKLIGDQMELCLSSDEPNEKGADAWEANEIVVPKEFEELPTEICPRASDFVNNERLKSWQYRAQKLARDDFAALKKKIGSAK